MVDKRIYTIKLSTNGKIKVPFIRLFDTDENVFSLKVFVEEGTNTGKILLSAAELVDYELKLKIIKPKSSQYREVDGVLDPVDGFFLFRMPKDCYNVPGTYESQLFFRNTLKTSDKADDEVISSKIFSYIVDSSIVTQLNQQIEEDLNEDTSLDLINKINDWDDAYNHSQEPHAPADAQKNSDITKAEIEEKLTGVINSHSHELGEYIKESELGLKTLNVTTIDKTLEGSINELANDKVNVTDLVDALINTDVFKPLSDDQDETLKNDLGDVSTLNITEETNIVGIINELQEMQPEVTLDATPTQNIVVDEDIKITLPTDLSFRKIRLNLVNSKTPNYIASTSTTPGALVVVDNDVLVSGQIRLSDANKYGGTFIVGNYVEFVSGEIMATFKQGDVIKKFKVGADSLNEFEMLLNEGKSVIRKFSDVAVELTTEEEQAGIMK